MFSKDEASKLKEQFWITFGRYMKPVPNAEGELINWVNYRTGVKHINFKMDAEQKYARVAIEISHPNFGVRELIFQQFEAFKMLLTAALGEGWDWELEAKSIYGKEVARISCTLPQTSVYNKEHWPAIIAFLKPRIIALDTFWLDVKPVFEELK